MEKALVYTTWGPTDPTRAGLALTYAMTAETQGMDVCLFLFHDAVLLANRKMYPKIIPVGPPPAGSTIDYLIEQNVKVYVCKPCYELRGLSVEDLIPVAELKGMELFAELSKTARTVTF